MDEALAFQGPQDRYDFKLAGKKEVFMMYNMHKITDYRVCPDEVFHTKNFVNPDCTRWELHRAWVIEATLKPGFRHILPKRVLYFDEDSWAAGFGEAWDAAGKIYRIDNMPSFAWYFQPTEQTANYTVTYDLQTGIVSTFSGLGFPGSGYNPISTPLEKTHFTPEALAGEGIR